MSKGVKTILKATEEYIKEHFELYNRAMFGGTLPVPPIHLTNARTYMGMLTCRKRVGLFGKKHFSNFALRFSKRFDFTEQELQDTLIHEMIHYYISYNQLQDSSAHGQLFRQMMDEINQKYGRHITISHRSSKEERLQVIGNRPRPRVFAIIEMKGKHFIKSVPRIAMRIRTMHRWLLSAPEVKSVQWYYSIDPYFAIYPSSMGRHVQRIDLNEIQPHLLNATPLGEELTLP